MKPFRIFVFLVAVMGLLSTIAYFMPEHGIKINGSLRVTFLSFSDIFNDRSTPNVDNVERLLAGSSVTEDPESDPVAVEELYRIHMQTRSASSHDVLGGLEDSGNYTGRTPGALSGGSRAPEKNNASPELETHQGSGVDPRTEPGAEPVTGSETGSETESGTGSGAEPETKPGTESVTGSAPNPGAGTRSAYREEELFNQKSRKIRSANLDSLQHSVFPIHFSDDGVSLLAPFFKSLDDMKEGSSLRARILHFGDSQIENDRMTALIRYRLQKNFGGTGSGLVQAIPLYSGSMAYQQEQEGTWLRYTYFRNRDTTILHNTYGLMAAFASVPAPAGESWPKLHYSFNLARRSGRCDRIKVFMHSYREGATLVFNVNDTISDTLRNLPSGYSVADYQHVGIVKELKLHFNLPEGGRIYGISFESYTGLQVDNIAMRGSSGLIFSRMDRPQQEAMMKELSPSLILLQFGGNVVPYMNARYYRREFEKELAFFKEICPGIPIIVIGPADMSVRERGEFKTYPGLEKIRDALKYATLESGFAFWDLYEAMGGYNSMPSFVHSEPPLASTDYVHFNGLGINLVAEMFYNALMREYERFSQTSHP
jgi:hypothetical protein